MDEKILFRSNLIEEDNSELDYYYEIRYSLVIGLHPIEIRHLDIEDESVFYY
jgi:hypothetical protein